MVVSKDAAQTGIDREALGNLAIFLDNTSLNQDTASVITIQTPDQLQQLNTALEKLGFQSDRPGASQNNYDPIAGDYGISGHRDMHSMSNDYTLSTALSSVPPVGTIAKPDHTHVMVATRNGDSKKLEFPLEREINRNIVNTYLNAQSPAQSEQTDTGTTQSWTNRPRIGGTNQPKPGFIQR